MLPRPAILLPPAPPVGLDGVYSPGPGLPCSHSAVIALYTCPAVCPWKDSGVEALMRDQIQFKTRSCYS